MSSKKPKIVVTDSIVDISKLKKFADVVQNPDVGPYSREKLLYEIADADGLFCLIRDKVNKELLDSAKKLRVVSTMSVGCDHIDLTECRKRGIRIGYTADVLTEATAELGVTLLLATSRRIPEALDAAKKGNYEWSPFFMCGKELFNSTVGIYGMGRIGKSVADKLLAFHPKQIIYHNRSPRIDISSEFFSYVSFPELLAKSDFIVICAQPTAENAGIFKKSAFKQMKKDSILVNISRGSVINQEDLLWALQTGTIAAAGLDVTDPEPLFTDSPLFQLANCVILPHIGSATLETRRRMVELTELNIINVLIGKPMVSELH